MRRMIKCDEEQDGLCLLETSRGNGDQIPLSHFTETFSSNKD